MSTKTNLLDFLSDTLGAHRSFAEILQEVVRNGEETVSVVNVGVVLEALNTLAESRFDALARQAKMDIGNIVIEEQQSEGLSSTIHTVFSELPGEGVSREASAGESSSNFHTDACSEHLSAGDSSVQSA